MKKLDKLIAINKLSKKNSKWVHRDIFRILRNDKIWIAAYEKLKKNKSVLTSDNTQATMDRMSLIKLKEKVCSEAYKFKSVKLIYITKLDERKQFLNFSTASDKIVQEVMRMILEAIYKPIFSKLHFGFRVKLACHNVLAHVERKFRWVDYVVERDIKQVYPIISHATLVKIIEKRINDHRFIRLVWKLLGCGVLSEEWALCQKSNISQNNLVSSTLVNIYYHELDEFVEGLKVQLETLKTDQKHLKRLVYKSLEHKINKVFTKIGQHDSQSIERQELAKKLKQLRKERFQTEESTNKVIRIEYVRYANDWMIGVVGDKKFALQVKDKVIDFMKSYLKQKFYSVKIKIINLKKGTAHFLGYDLFFSKNRPITSYNKEGVKTIRRENPKLRLNVPVTKVTQRYIKLDYLKKLPDKIRPISKAFYTVLEDHVIISHYRKIWLRFFHYYSGCTNRRQLQYIHSLLHISCAMTLAHRHRTSCSKIFKKHGKSLTVKILYKKKTVSFSYKTNWKKNERRWLLGRNICISTNDYANVIARTSIRFPV